MNDKQEVLIKKYPELERAIKSEEMLWINKNRKPYSTIKQDTVPVEMIFEAETRWKRFAPYIMAAFPETVKTNGVIESDLLDINNMRNKISKEFNVNIDGNLLLKMDSQLPISGSVKARGGLYEVVKYAETLALENNLLKETDDYSILNSPELHEFFGNYTIQVGSTGNLGLSIGIISAKLGFKVIVHMSSDAKEWKKAKLRSHGVEVIEYATDYCEAVERGREESDKNPHSYFVDDEQSVDLFLGYSVAGLRLKRQLEEKNIVVDDDHPLFVYLPCGIGGAPGGITFGLRDAFGDNVHCFFTEPTNACCMLMGVATGLHDETNVVDYGISGVTDADGLAVNRPSAFVGKIVEPHLSGIGTINDDKLYVLMDYLLETQDIFIEPSACASFGAIIQESLNDYIIENNIKSKDITHIAWATGGDMVPEDARNEYKEKAKKIRANIVL